MYYFSAAIQLDLKLKHLSKEPPNLVSQFNNVFYRVDIQVFS